MASIKQVNINDTIYDIKDSYTNILYGKCSTPATTPNKVITTQYNPNVEIKPGTVVIIYFSATNISANPKIVINNKPYTIRYNNQAINANPSVAVYGGLASTTCIYIYDGTYFQFLGWGAGDASMWQNVVTDTTAANKPLLLSGSNIGVAANRASVNRDNNLYYNPSTQTLTVGHVNGSAEAIVWGTWDS